MSKGFFQQTKTYCIAPRSTSLQLNFWYLFSFQFVYNILFQVLALSIFLTFCLRCKVFSFFVPFSPQWHYQIFLLSLYECLSLTKKSCFLAETFLLDVVYSSSVQVNGLMFNQFPRLLSFHKFYTATRLMKLSGEMKKCVWLVPASSSFNAKNKNNLKSWNTYQMRQLTRTVKAAQMLESAKRRLRDMFYLLSNTLQSTIAFRPAVAKQHLVRNAGSWKRIKVTIADALPTLSYQKHSWFLYRSRS